MLYGWFTSKTALLLDAFCDYIKNCLSDKIILLPRLQRLSIDLGTSEHRSFQIRAGEAVANWGKPTTFKSWKETWNNCTTIKLKILQRTSFHLYLYNPKVLLILSVAVGLSLPAKAVSVIRMWSCFTEVTIKPSSQVHRSKPLSMSKSKVKHCKHSCSVFQ